MQRQLRSAWHGFSYEKKPWASPQQYFLIYLFDKFLGINKSLPRKK